MVSKDVLNKTLDSILEILKDTKRHSTMGTMHLDDFVSEFKETIIPARKNLDETPVTDFIRDKTEVWRLSWIIGPLEEAISKIEDLKRK